MIRFRQLHPTATIPTQATPGSACYDAYAHIPAGTRVTYYDEDNTEHSVVMNELYPGLRLFRGNRYLIPTGWAVKIPHELSMRVYSRSGLALKQGLVVVNAPGIIDSDYRHEVFVILANTGGRAIDLVNGTRVCQIDFVKTVFHDPFVVTQCEDDKWFDAPGRLGGFGSTGISKK